MARQSVFDMKFSKIYPLLLQKVEKKGRTKAELDEIITWLTGYEPDNWDSDADYRTFFNDAPNMNPNAVLIKGTVCGVRVENIDDSLMQKIRWLDKLVDELAKGKKLDKILR